MTKRGMRGFAAGLWIAAAILAYFHYLSPQATTTSAKSSATITAAQVQQYLTNHKQIAVDEKTYESMKSTANSSKKSQAGKKKTNTNKKTKTSSQSKTKKNPTKAVKNYTLNIQNGMTGGEIGAQLEKAGIISNKYDLVNYLQGHHIAQRVQLGKFTVNSKMTVAEIAKKIT